MANLSEKSYLWVDHILRKDGKRFRGTYDMRADFATHDLVCGDHDGYPGCRWSVGVDVGGAIRYLLRQAPSGARIAESAESAGLAVRTDGSFCLSVCLQARFQRVYPRPWYHTKGVQGTMSNNKESNTVVQRSPAPSEGDPLPRTKLPIDLQKRVDDEETLLDQIYDGT